MPYPWRLFPLFILLLLVTSSSFTEQSQSPSTYEKLYENAKKLETSGLTSDAVSKYEESLKVAQDSNNQRGVAKNLIALARIKSVAGKYEEAMRMIQNAREIGEETQDKKIAVEALIQMSDVFSDQSKYKDATEIGELALAKAKELNDDEMISNAYRMLGNSLYYQGLFNEALSYYQQALKHAEKTNDPTTICQSLHVLGNTFNGIGDMNQAIKHFLRAIQKAKEADNKIVLPKIHSGIAAAYKNQGMYEQATEHFQQALEIAEANGSKTEQALVLNNLGNLYKIQGYYDQALSNYSQSLKIAEDLKHLRGIAILLNNIGNLYAAEGLFEKALTSYEKALQMREQINDRWGIASCLNNIGTLYENQKKYDPAIEYEQRALKIAEDIGDKSNVALFINNLGDAFFAQRNYQEAEKYYEKSLNLATEIHYKHLIGFSLKGIGNVNLKLHKLTQASQNFHKALSLGEEISRPLIIWSSSYGLAKVYEEMNDNRQALHFYQAAIDEIEKVRSRASSEEGKSGFLAENLQVYEDLIGFLYRLHTKYPKRNYDAQAFDYSERAKARALLDTLAEFQSGLRKGLGFDQAQRESAILGKISKIQSQLWETSDQQKQKEAKQKLQDAEAELDQFILGLKLNSPEYAQLSYPEPYTLSRAQKQLDANTAVVEYFVGEKQSYVFAIDSKSVQIHALPPRTELDEAIRKYQGRISKPPHTSIAGSAKTLQQQYQQQAHTLFQQLIAPVQKIITGKQNLILILDGILHYVPFETLLMDKNRSMIEAYRIIYAPSITVWANLKGKSKQQNTKELFAFGDPVLPANSSDSDVSWRRNLGPLRYSREEIQEIVSLYPQGASTVNLGNEATESKFRINGISDYKIIHLATHAIIDEEVPRHSGVILSPDPKEQADGVLQMHEIWNLNLNAQLVVLSACQTGLGKLVNGEGMVSLMRAFFYAGANNVVVSLWNVDDKSTAELMKNFYIHMKTGETQAESLRQAKLDMIVAANSDSGYAAYSDPYYWAPFILIGTGN